MSQTQGVEHVFRHEYGQLVASLLRRVGSQHLQSVEDAVQHALMQALEFWVRQGEPENPSAWLYQVAYRKLISDFRSGKRREQILATMGSPDAVAELPEAEVPLGGEMTDSLLRMLFVACHEGIPLESQLVFTLKSLLGFSVREIALRLFITEANVYKRYGRARGFLEKQGSKLDDLPDETISLRLPTVHQILYLVFTEGYLSSHDDIAIRQDLCLEAIRLGGLLGQSKLGNKPESFALMALMHLHLARLNARQDQDGALILLDHQDRSQWDHGQMNRGLQYLQRSAQGETISRFHIEAGIAAEHCLAPSVEDTRWDRILSSYELLETMTASPFVRLNKVIAIAQWQGAEAGLAAFRKLEVPLWLEKSYHWFAVKADLLCRCKEWEEGQAVAEEALKLAPSEGIKKVLRTRFVSLFPPAKT